MITNSVGKLAQHETKRWKKRLTSDINKLIIHQAMSNGTVHEIAHYHTQPNHVSKTGCPSLCYHYAICQSGEIHKTAEHDQVTWHTKGQNLSSIGILVLGDFDGEGYKGTSDPTYYQWLSLRYLVLNLVQEFDLDLADVYCHADYGKPACPGFLIEEFIAWLYHTDGSAEIMYEGDDIL